MKRFVFVLLVGCLALPIAPAYSTPASNFSSQTSVCDPTNGLGKNCFHPIPTTSMVRGTASSTDTGAHTIIASAGSGVKNYITDINCHRTDAGATEIEVTFNDSATTPMAIPPLGEFFWHGNIPLVTAAATAFQFTMGTGVTTAKCSAQGYVGP